MALATFTILERGITTFWGLAHGACKSWEFRTGRIHGDRNSREFQTGRSQHDGVKKMAVARFWSLEHGVRNIKEYRTWRPHHLGVENMAFATILEFRAWPTAPHGPFWAQIWAPHGPRWAQACLRAIMGPTMGHPWTMMAPNLPRNVAHAMF
jgi:hypothetical protein